ncbi:MAG: alkaline phosphatase PhoX, partial [Burkholderiales bacterium]
MSHGYSDGKNINPSSNPSFNDIIDARLSRRTLLKGAASWVFAGSLPLALAGCATGGLKRAGTLGFKSVSLSKADTVRVPDGYTATVLLSWGDPIGHPDHAPGSPAFRQDASNTADEQALQTGMHHDGIHYFSLPYGNENATSALLALNNEYTDDGLLHSDGFANWSAEKVRKSQHAHGVTVVEVRAQSAQGTLGGRWEVVR